VTVHQVVVAAAPHDAVTNDALALQKGLATAHGASEVYARYVHPDLAGVVHPLEHVPDAAADLLVYHVTIGEPRVAEFLLARPEPVMVVYHNITPPEFFRPWSARFAALLAGGREQLRMLRPRVVHAVADSRFNASELAALGYDDVAVTPLAVDLLALRDSADDGSAERVLAGIDGPVYLFVGQLMPHKRPDLLVQAFHILSTYLEPDAGLVMVGAARHARYGTAVEQLVRELALSNVRFPGAVPLPTLAGLYRRADAFVTMSEHEGFCIPIVEAMSVGLPVVARRFAAIPDTAGGAALLLDAGDGPAVAAEAMHAVVADADLRRTMTEAGRRTVDTFTAVDPVDEFLRHVEVALA